MYKTDHIPIKIPVANIENSNCKYLRIKKEFTDILH